MRAVIPFPAARIVWGLGFFAPCISPDAPMAGGLFTGRPLQIRRRWPNRPARISHLFRQFDRFVMLKLSHKRRKTA